MSEPTRREFLSTVAVMTPLAGLVLPPPPEERNYNIEIGWCERGGEEETYLWKFGVAETWLFPASSSSWYIRCGGVWRPEPMFQGSLEEAKKEAERFTRETLKKTIIAVEKVVFALPERK